MTIVHKKEIIFEKYEILGNNFERQEFLNNRLGFFEIFEQQQ